MNENRIRITVDGIADELSQCLQRIAEAATTQERTELFEEMGDALHESALRSYQLAGLEPGDALARTNLVDCRATEEGHWKNLPPTGKNH